MGKNHKKILYVGLVSLLLCEMTVVFFGVSLMLGVFLYVAIIVSFFPTDSYKILFPLSLLLFAATVISVILTLDGYANALSLYTFFAYILLTWSLIIQFFRTKKWHSSTQNQ